MSAVLRLVNRNGKSATIETFTAGAADSQGDPTWTASLSSTKALVKLSGQSGVVVRTESGDERQIDAVIVVPEADAVDPDGEDRPPEIVVEGKRYVIELLDPHVLDGVRRLLCTLSRV